eukprot:gnl/TRDRNA2_/TRDRNA2_164090_c0_seq2.p1 gnl/TRDRNA2_/TRDRNA2_164090_c0~~gnl/TRDRNA2_/TRDRNA2_164090_c0_seq2.p1  ORF type:complete len:170 (+),score=8.14 gnl/TRDRNA2_/TRDRNA2_164090_c0_seq2:193-702(+)
MMSYSTFYVNRSAAPARGGAATVCLLTLANMITGVRSSLPKSRGDRSIVLLDVLQVSLFFCFYTVLQFALGHWLMRAKARAATFWKSIKETVSVQFSEDSATGQIVDITTGPNRVITSWKECSRAVGTVTSLFMKADGTLRFDDEDLDRISQYVYAPAYIIVIIILMHS